MQPPDDTRADAAPRRDPSHALIAGTLALATLAAAAFVHNKVPFPTSAETQGTLSGRINPNSATAAELATLPSIGPTKAEAIVAYREKHRAADRKPFETAEDLTRIRGIGPKTIEKLRSRVRFDD